MFFPAYAVTSCYVSDDAGNVATQSCTADQCGTLFFDVAFPEGTSKHRRSLLIPKTFTNFADRFPINTFTMKPTMLLLKMNVVNLCHSV